MHLPGIFVGLFVTIVSSASASNTVLNSKACGLSNYGRAIRRPIDARPKEFPWLARLGYRSHKDDHIEYFFQGILIHPSYVITTVFASEYNRNSLKYVRLGDFNTSTDPDCEDQHQCAPAPQDIPIELIIKHPDYNDPRFSNDLVLLKLQSPVDTSSDYVETACIPTEANFLSLENAPLFMSAWCGSRSAGISVIPRQYRVQYMGPAICAEKLSDHLDIDLHRSQFCAALDLDKQTLQSLKEDINLRGSTGAPVQMIAPDGRFYVVGMMSVGVRDAPLGMPYVLVDLRHMAGRLERTIADEEKNARFNRTDTEPIWKLS